jgi:hypothetical protein
MFEADVDFMHTQTVESQRLSDQYAVKARELNLLQDKVVFSALMLSNVASCYGQVKGAV